VHFLSIEIVGCIYGCIFYPLPDDSSIHRYIFWTLEKEKSNEVNIIHNTSIIGSATGYLASARAFTKFSLTARTKKAICAPGRQYVLAMGAFKATTTIACWEETGE
jgi:hypothetical protein